MAIGTPILNTFNAGELDPRLNGRTDIKQYYQSAESLLNMISEFRGGAKKAPGTKYVAEVKDSSAVTIIKDFVFSDTQAYIIEIGNLYMRFYRDNGQILDGTAYEITTSYPTSALRTLQFSQKADLVYVNHPDYPDTTLTRTGHTAWTIAAVDYTTTYARPALMDLNVTATTITASASAGAGIILTSSVAVFDETHKDSIWAIGLVSGSHGYAQIVSVSSSGLKTVATANVLYSGIVTTSATADWYEGAWSDYRGHPRSSTIHEGRRYVGYTAAQPQTVWGSQVRSYNNFALDTSLAAEGIMFEMDTSKIEVIKWLFSASELLAGTTGGLHSFGTGSQSSAITPANALRKKKASYGASEIRPEQIGQNVYYWQAYNRTLREYAYSLTLDNYEANDATAFNKFVAEEGIVDMAYQQSPDNILWCVREDGKLAVFVRQLEHKVAGWMTHDTEGYYESVAVIPKTTYDEVWFVVRRTVDGSTVRYVEYMVAPTFSDQEDAFFVHSGADIDLPSTITAATAANPVVITVSQGYANGDRIKIRGVVGMTELNNKDFLVASRTTTAITLTDLDGDNVDGTGYTAYASAGETREMFNTVSGLDHLEAKEVDMLVDGATHPSRTVGSGVITLDGYYSQIAVGLGYTGRIKTLELEVSAGTINSHGRDKSIASLTIEFYRTLGASVGTTSQMDDVVFRTSGMPMDQAPTLYTGHKEVPFPGDWEKKKQITIEQTQPLPMHVLSIVPKIEVN